VNSVFHRMKWVDTLKNSGISYEVNDLWDSLKDGIALSALIEDLAPGSIKLDELKPENAVENLRNAFQIAETQLGIPSLLAVEDFEAGKEPDEKAVENYLCMLVSAQKAQVKRVSGFDTSRLICRMKLFRNLRSK